MIGVEVRVIEPMTKAIKNASNQLQSQGMERPLKL